MVIKRISNSNYSVVRPMHLGTEMTEMAKSILEAHLENRDVAVDLSNINIMSGTDMAQLEEVIIASTKSGRILRFACLKECLKVHVRGSMHGYLRQTHFSARVEDITGAADPSTESTGTSEQHGVQT